ncbi:MAG: hypothetical protein ACOYLH_04420 [Flavobacteriales bacterium]
MKKYFAFIIIAACVIFIGYVVFTFSQSNPSTGNAWDAVPSEATMIIKINKSTEAGEIMEAVLPQDALLTPWREGVKNLFGALSTTGYQSPREILFTANAAGTYLVILPLSNTTTEDQIVNLANTFCGTQAFSQTQFEDAKIYSNESFTHCHFGDLLLISPSSSLVESAVLQAMKAEDEQNALQQINTMTASDVALSFFGKWDDGAWMFVEPHQLDAAQLIYTGYAVAADSTAKRLRLGMNGRAERIGDLLPANTLASETWTYPDASTMREKIDGSRVGSSEETFWLQSWSAASDSCQCDINDAIVNWRSGIQGSFAVQVNDSTTHFVSFIQASDSINLASTLGALAVPTAAGTLSLRFPELFRRYDLTPFLTEHSFGLQIENTFYLCANEQVLLNLKQALSLGNSLQRKSNVNAIIEGEKNMISYTGGSYLSGVFPMSLAWIFSANESGGTIAMQDDGKYLIKWQGERERERELEQEQENLEKPGTSEIKPAQLGSWVVVNHNTKEKEKLVQNADNSIALIDANGKELWKAAIPGPIVGEVTQVDALNNGKLQMAFAINNAIYIIDRNGKSLTGFPVRISSTITTGLVVLDYDKNKNYRLFVGCVNGSLYNYQINGQPAKGWTFGDGATPVKIEHQKVKGEDRLIITYKSGEKKKFKKTGQPI